MINDTLGYLPRRLEKRLPTASMTPVVASATEGAAIAAAIAVVAAILVVQDVLMVSIYKKEHNRKYFLKNY